MEGIVLNQPILYKHSSLRYFEKNEKHVQRFCEDDVLVMVFDGVLRFSEDGIQKEIRAGEYYVQKKNVFQNGEIPSDAPQYLYVHFDGVWASGEGVLPKHGLFSYAQLAPLMQELDRRSHTKHTYIEQASIFYQLLCALFQKKKVEASPADSVLQYIQQEFLHIERLEDLCELLHYSKNYVIRIFKDAFHTTPFAYINELKIERAMYLLESTSISTERVAAESGFKQYSHFYRLFLKKTGVSPLVFRKQMNVHPVARSS